MTACFVLILAANFIFWALSPAISKKEFPSKKIVQFQTSKLPSPYASKSLPETISLLTYNIGYASGEKNNKGSILNREEVVNNLNQIAQTTTTINADVVALQEVDFSASRTFNINQLDYLAEKTGYPYAAWIVLWNKKYLPWPYWPVSLHFGKIVSGQAVLSRYPISSQKITFYKKPAANFFWYNWFYLDRAEQALTLYIGVKKMVVWNVHLEAFDGEARFLQATLLAKSVAETTADIKFVLGDFNSASWVDTSRLKEEKLEESTEALQFFLKETGFKNAEIPPPLYTMPSWDPVKKIDHILYSSPYIMKSGRVGTMSLPQKLTASDHLPVWAEFTTPPRKPRPAGRE